MVLKRMAKMEAELARLSDLHCELAEQYNRLRDELDAQRGLALAGHWSRRCAQKEART